MKHEFARFCSLVLVGVVSMNVGFVFSQGQNSLASTLEVYVFPSGGQPSSQQSSDEGVCFEWAVSNTGTDPFYLSKQATLDAQMNAQAQQQASQVGRGAGVGGAIGGAAAGALIGEIADDDAGKGAAIGATLGAIRARRQAAAARSQAEQHASSSGASASAATKQKNENFKSAFAACLEGKKYTVRY